jgi:hypothetical protein
MLASATRRLAPVMANLLIQIVVMESKQDLQ